MPKSPLLKLSNACFQLFFSYNEGGMKEKVENIDHQEREREVEGKEGLEG